MKYLKVYLNFDVDKYLKSFRKEFKDILEPYIKDITKIKIPVMKIYGFSGFFTTNNDKIYYFSLIDLRNSLNEYPKLLIRTAKDYKDFTGGHNNFIDIDENFKDRLLGFIDR